jgi:hypothetical protein
MLRKMRQAAQEEVWPLLNLMGKAGFLKLIDENKSFATLIPVEKMPESWKAAIPQAAQYSWVNNIITDADYWWLLPEWLAALVVTEDKSWSWFLNEVATTKKLIFGG